MIDPKPLGEFVDKELLEKFKIKDNRLPTEQQYFSHDRRIQDLESEVSALKISLKATQKLLTDYISNEINKKVAKEPCTSQWHDVHWTIPSECAMCGMVNHA